MHPEHPILIDSAEEPQAWRFKLDLQYFTTPDLCPRMASNGARRAFALFLFLAHDYLQADGQPIGPTHASLCRACGLDPSKPDSRPAVSWLLRQLRETYGVIDYVPVRNRRPQIRLRPLADAGPSRPPPLYVHLGEGWSPSHRAAFDTLGEKAFAAEYLYWIAKYQAALAYSKQHSAYWFHPLDRLAQTFHISPQFASRGLQALVDLGLMHVHPGQRSASPDDPVVGRCNRYYFGGWDELRWRTSQLATLAPEYASSYGPATTWAAELINGTTVKNVEGLCRLIAEFGEVRVAEVIQRLSKYRRHNPRRKLAYVAAVLRKTASVAADDDPPAE